MTAMLPSTSVYAFPRDYYFPPFFTRQPNSTTFHAQCQKWSTIIQGYCRANRLWKLSLVDVVDTELFCNRCIGKRIALEDAKEIVEFMRKEGRAEWLGGGKNKDDGERWVAWIWWRTPEEWAEHIENWVDETGQKNMVLTLYELTESEATISNSFHGMDPDLLQRTLALLVRRGKAQIFGQADQQGVKFF